MSFDENIFFKFFKFQKKRNEKKLLKRKIDHNSFELEAIQFSLTLFASAIFEKNIEIKMTESWPCLFGNKIYLPKFIGITLDKELNEKAYYLIILNLFGIEQILPKIAHHHFQYQNYLTLIENKIKIQNRLKDIFPNYSSLFNTVTRGWSEIELLETPVSAEEFKNKERIEFNKQIIFGMPSVVFENTELSDNNSISPEALPKPKTELAKKNTIKVNKVQFDEEQENIGQDVFHHFEKVETLEEYKGVMRDLDGSDELLNHADALEDLNIEEVIRTSKTTQSLYKADLDSGFEIADLEVEIVNENTFKKFYYDEWDTQKHQYKKNWCTVYESRELRTKNIADQKTLDYIDENKKVVRQIQSKFKQLSNEIEIKKRLTSGREIDLDNFIRDKIKIKLKLEPSLKIYKETKKKYRDFATLLLIDTSLSADSWVQNRRVLDLCLQSLLAVGEASHFLNDSMMVAGFNSNTRQNCQFKIYKDFQDPWSQFINMADSIKIENYTRIGPAIRHAKTILSKRKEKNKLLIIFTDGRPTDFDRYEGSYGLSDVRKAITETEGESIVPFAVAVDPSAKQFLPNLFGMHNFQVVNHVEELPEKLLKLYVRLSNLKG